MALWFESLTAIERFFAYAAIPATLILIIQTILLIFGLFGDSDADFDADADDPTDGDSMADAADSGLRLFTVRGFVAFFTVFGWGGLALLRAGIPTYISVPLAALMGFLSMLVMAIILRLCLNLQSDGTMRPQNAVGQSGSVYLTIPPARQGRGKVEVLVQDQLCELEAVTDESQPIPTGCEVVVTAVSGRSTLVVCRK